MQFVLLGILFTLLICVYAQKSWKNPKFASEERCMYVVDPGPCKDKILVWGYDPFARKCEKFFYGGCGGNPNRFTKLKNCREACRDRKGQSNQKGEDFEDFEDNEGTTNKNGSDYFDAAPTTTTTTTATTEHEYVDSDFDKPTKSTDFNDYFDG